jgi:DNA-binding transcriptional LysR family regulator
LPGSKINPYATHRSNSEEWIINMIRAGIGVALISEYTLPKDADGVNYRYLSDPAISRQIYVIHASPLLQKNELKTLIVCLSWGFVAASIINLIPENKLFAGD